MGLFDGYCLNACWEPVPPALTCTAICGCIQNYHLLSMMSAVDDARPNYRYT